MTVNAKQANISDAWATEWAAIRQTVIRNLRQQQLEQRMQGVDNRVKVQMGESQAFIIAALRALETSSRQHAQAIRGRL